MTYRIITRWGTFYAATLVLAVRIAGSLGGIIIH